MIDTSQMTVDELQLQLSQKAKLEDINKKIFSTLDLDDILATIIDGCNELLGTERTTVFVVDFDPAGAPFELHTQALQESEITEIRVPVNENSFAGFCALNGKTIVIQDCYNDGEVAKISPTLKFNRTWDEKTGFRTRNMIVAPILFNEKPIGVIQAINKTDGDFSIHDDELAHKFASYCGLALNNVQSHQKAVSVARKRQTLQDLLVANGVISQEILEQALEDVNGRANKLPKHLIEKYEISDSDIFHCVSELNGLDYMAFNEDMEISKDLIKKATVKFCQKNSIVPYKLTQSGSVPALVVIMSNPKDFYTIDTIEMSTGYKVKKIFTSSPREIQAIIQQGITGKKVDLDAPAENVDHLIDEVAALTGGDEEHDLDMVDVDEGVSEDEGPIVKLANYVIEEAYRQGASDIHVEPFEKYTLVRYRKDGSLEKALTFPRHARKALVSRLKIMAEMNITERRLPQDGRIKFKECGGRYNIELRVNSCPTVGEENEDIVMRILADSKPMPLEKGGMLKVNFDNFLKLVNRPYGMNLVVGPTGSGKTTTLHSAVAYINTPERKILTAENPVEITQEGLRQVQIKHKIGLDFKEALRSFLRQDPDVIMIGEMRDFETCSIAVEAALTGHLLFSTLHTNNAPETITRLVDIGLDPVVLSDALLCVLAQRLVKRICKDCREKYIPDEDERKKIGMYLNDKGEWMFNSKVWKEEDIILYNPKGCSKCDNKGSKGRLAIHELLVVDEEIKRQICAKAKVYEIKEVACAGGMIPLLNDGIEKCLMGDTWVNDILRVCSE